MDTSNIATLSRRRKVPAGQITSIECRKCGNVKPINSFPRTKKTKLGRASTCRDCKNEKQRADRLTRRCDRKCRTCEAMMEPDTKRQQCRDCLNRGLQRQMNMFDERRKAGLCIHCAQTGPAEGRHSCKTCLERMRDTSASRRLYRRENGLCLGCGDAATIRPSTRQPNNPGKDLTCETCYFKLKAKMYLGSGHLWPVLQAKWKEQGGRCPYTGELLILGRTATVDHIHPQSRFPELATDPSNMEWTSDRINKTKGNLTKDEFLSLIRSIAAQFPE